MRFLSIDIGIKNLAFCLFCNDNDTNTYQIELWDVIDLSNQDKRTCIYKKQKKGDANNNTICNKLAAYVKGSECYCLTHAKKHPTYKLPNGELSLAKINKLKIQPLQELANKYNLTTHTKKADILTLFKQYIETNCFEQIGKTNASKLDIVTIGKNIKERFSNTFNMVIDTIIIENQIGPIANRMKTIQGMVSQYFIMTSPNDIKIEFISAANKLKMGNTVDDSSTYKNRKSLGITYCRQYLIKNMTTISNNWLTYFESHKKKDDLADAFLQGIWYTGNKAATLY